MIKAATEKTIGWRNDEGVVFCPKCFDKHRQSKELNKGVEWYPIKKEKSEENAYMCDECQMKL